jgi:CubicO group peptidase (beta-lactamase class C family)
MMNKSNLFSSVCYVLLGCIIVVSLAGCTTQDKDDETVVLYTGEKILIEPDELESFVDDFMAEQLDQRHIPGLTIIVVQDGQVLLAKGYGSANLEKKVAFDSNETVVRIASISKLFVATAVMQLVEQGKLDLHADVNQYLGNSAFQVDDTFPEPVTLAHLLTHTSGYGESTENNTDPAAIPPLETYLAENMPPRLEPPGESWIYSGHGMAIAALVVEKVSGLPFDQYVLENILEPLDMSQSYYLLSPPLPDDLAMGYVHQDGEYIPQLIEYYGDYPAASLVSTAADMAKFMIAHLQEGCYQDRCILQSATVTEMHQRQTDTEFGGHAYGFIEGIKNGQRLIGHNGFIEGIKNGQRLIGHSGAIHGFGNILDLFPAHDLGYFFSFNLECMDSSACGIISEFRQQFVDRFLTFED